MSRRLTIPDTLYRQSIAKLLGGFATPWTVHEVVFGKLRNSPFYGSNSPRFTRTASFPFLGSLQMPRPSASGRILRMASYNLQLLRLGVTCDTPGETVREWHNLINRGLFEGGVYTSGIYDEWVPQVIVITDNSRQSEREQWLELFVTFCVKVKSKGWFLVTRTCGLRRKMSTCYVC